MPKPVHRLVSRQTFLHLAVENDVRRFHEYAPMNVSFRSVDQTKMDMNDAKDKEEEEGRGEKERENKNKNTENGNSKSSKNNGNGDQNLSANKEKSDDSGSSNTYPKCWFEDELTGTPLRWQLFVGIIYDFIKLRHDIGTTDHPPQHKATTFLPWKIRIHFTSYPESLLQIDHEENVSQLIFRQYMNALKQSLFIQHNSNKFVNNMSKQNHLQIWDGIKRNQFQVYNEVAKRLNGANSSSSSGSDRSSDNITLENVPVRVLVDSRPAFARPCSCTYESDDGTKQHTSIGRILNQWLPDFFKTSNNGDIELSMDCQWCVQGIQVPLTTYIADLWKVLCHPDRFLYVIIVTKN